MTVPSSTYRGNDVPLIGSYFCRTWRTERSALLHRLFDTRVCSA